MLFTFMTATFMTLIRAALTRATVARMAGIAVLALLLGACGFQMRGVQDSIESRYEHIRVSNSSRDEPFAQILRQSLKNAGVTLSEDAGARLDIIGSKQEKRTASYSSRAKSAEFELIKTVTFRFRNDGKELISHMPIQARRSYLYRETVAVGKAEEERLLWQEMDQDLAQRILLALQRTVANTRSQVAEPSSDTTVTPSAETGGSPTESTPVPQATPPETAPETAPENSVPADAATPSTDAPVTAPEPAP